MDQKTIKTKQPLKSSASVYKEEIFNNGSLHFEHMIQDINAAQKSIHLETYIYNKDILGKKVTQALSDAAARGVEVKILADGAGGPFLASNYATTIERSGGHVHVYHPYPWQLWNYSRSHIKLPFLIKWIYLFLKANKRNHRKVCIIDDKIGYIGSMNISKDHIATIEGGGGWRDTSIRLENTNFDTLNKAFESAWNHRKIQVRLKDIFRNIRRDPIFRLNYSWLHRRVLYKHLLRKIRLCKKRIWITNAYFVPDNILLRRIKEAAKKGVDVRILLPKKSDVFMMPWASSTFYYSLLMSGVRIFEYLPSNLHAKTFILDNWMLVGSSNLNYRSLLHDLEVDVRVHKKSSKDKLVTSFLDDLTQSKEIYIDDLGSHRPWRQRLLGRIVLYLKYWI